MTGWDVIYGHTTSCLISCYHLRVVPIWRQLLPHSVQNLRRLRLSYRNFYFYVLAACAQNSLQHGYYATGLVHNNAATVHANDYWTAVQHADITSPQWATLSIHSVVNTSTHFPPADSRRLSWPELTVSYVSNVLKVACSDLSVTSLMLCHWTNATHCCRRQVNWVVNIDQVLDR